MTDSLDDYDELRVETIVRKDGTVETYVMTPDGSVIGKPGRTSAFKATPAALAGFEGAAMRLLRRRRPDLQWSVMGDDSDTAGQRGPSAGHDDIGDDTA